MNTEERNRDRFMDGVVFGAATGILSLLAIQYLSGILRQPSLLSRVVLSDSKAFDSIDARALFIAAENLRSGIEARSLADGRVRQTLHAGYRNFRESWARDFGFASYGLLALKEYQTVGESLEAFFFYQSQQGQLPVKLHSVGSFTRFLYSLLEREQPLTLALKPRYTSAHGAPSLDGQALLVIAALNYSRERRDLDFLSRYWGGLQRALQWLDSAARVPGNPLLHQGAYADWADSVARRGHVLYTNVVFWKALQEMTVGARMLEKEELATYFEEKAHRVAEAIQQQFWRPEQGYFVTSDQLTQLSSAGNLLAAGWGLTTPSQTEAILDALESAGMADPVPTQAANPPYPSHLIALENRLGGMAHYHTSAAWLWIGAWHVIVLEQAGRVEEARRLLARISGVIVRDGQVLEVYGPDGQRLSSLWYKSESPLTWNAGMVVYAFHLLEAGAGRAEDQRRNILKED
jgi:glycogen debranching enzyme